MQHGNQFLIMGAATFAVANTIWRISDTGFDSLMSTGKFALLSGAIWVAVFVVIKKISNLLWLD